MVISKNQLLLRDTQIHCDFWAYHTWLQELQHATSAFCNNKKGSVLWLQGMTNNYTCTAELLFTHCFVGQLRVNQFPFHQPHHIHPDMEQVLPSNRDHESHVWSVLGNSVRIVRSANTSEADKSRHIQAAEKHIVCVQKELAEQLQVK